MLKPTMIGGAAVLATVVAGYMFGIAPQAKDTAALASQVTSVEATNTSMQQQIPELKAKLSNIAGSVDSLKVLSGQVPPAIDLPALYSELDLVAAAAGAGVEITNVSVSVPALIDETAAPADSAVVEVVASDAVLASYTVSIDLKANPTQAAAFVTALGQSTRMSVVSSSGLTTGVGNSGTAHVSATLYLQQVDVAGLAAQIEALAALSAAETDH